MTNPQPAMKMQKIMRWGHDFLRMRGGMFKLEPLGKIHMSKGNATKLSTNHFLSFSPIFYFCQNLVEVVIAWELDEYGEKNRIGKSTHFFKNLF